MSKSFFLAVVFVLGSAVPVLAQSACTAPIAPAALDGSAATIDQVRGAVKDAKDFIAQSDIYQECVGKEIDDAKAKAKTDSKPVDQAMVDTDVAQVNANQKMKEKVGAEANGAVAAYKKAHPGP